MSGDHEADALATTQSESFAAHLRALADTTEADKSDDHLCRCGHKRLLPQSTALGDIHWLSAGGCGSH